MQYVLRFAVIIIVFSSCNSYKAKYPYSLNDFKPELRKHLEKIVQNGGRCDDDIDYGENNSSENTYSYLKNNTSVSHLEKLINAEHPILRAYGFKVLCNKDSFDIDNLLLHHLDDTATIIWCKGEWGEDLIYVSDYFLVRRMIKNKILNKSLKDEVIINHSYLRKAYQFISEVDKPEEKYYPIIKKMIKKARQSEDLNTALYALSTYKKKEDISFITEELFANWRRFEDEPFKLIKDNPDTAYFKILERYFRYISYGTTEADIQVSFYRSPDNIFKKYDSFLEALTSYKNKPSAEILAQIINRKIFPVESIRDRITELNWRKNELYDILLRNSCAAYKTLLAQLKPFADAYKRKHVLLVSE